MISIGSHRARATAGTFGGKPGKEQVEVKFEIIDGPDTGQSISWFGFFHGKDPEKAKANARRATESLLHSGWDGEFTEDLVFAPAEVTIVVEHDRIVKDGNIVLDESGEPKLRAVVRWVNALGGGLVMKERMDRAGLAEFRKRMMGTVIDVRKSMGPSQQAANGSRYGTSGHGASAKHTGTPEQGFGGGVDEDEVPF
jgi:hypothetical protein